MRSLLFGAAALLACTPAFAQSNFLADAKAAIQNAGCTVRTSSERQVAGVCNSEAKARALKSELGKIAGSGRTVFGPLPSIPVDRPDQATWEIQVEPKRS